MNQEIKDIENELFQEKFIKEFDKNYELRGNIGSLRISIFSAIFGIFSILTIIFPFNIDSISKSVIFADKVFIPDSLIMGVGFISISFLLAFIGTVLSVLRYNFIPFAFSIVMLATTSLYIHKITNENKELVNLICESKSSLFNLEKKTHPLFKK